MFRFEKKKNVPMLLGSIHMPAFLYGTKQELREIEQWLLRNVESFA